MVYRLKAALVAALVTFAPGHAFAASVVSRGLTVSGDLAGTVADSATGEPLYGAEVTVMRNGQAVSTTGSDQFGAFRLHGLAPGAYRVEARFIGYRPAVHDVVMPTSGADVSMHFRLVPAPMNLEAVTVTASTPIAVDTRTGDQVFDQNRYHGTPTNTTSQILQQSIAGAARAPTGEVHIRGQHAEYTYYIDGVPVPAGISGSLNELFDPAVANRIDFQTGGWDAEYGNKNTAVINVETKIPTGGFHATASAYAGSYQTDGQSLSLSTNAGRWGFFLSGTRQESAMRQEPVVADSLTDRPINFHNSGQDLFGFGKIQFTPTNHDIISLDLNWARTHFLTPFDSTEAHIDDRQQDINAFANLAWRHQFSGDSTSGEAGSELFLGAFARHGSLTYSPGPSDVPAFVFFPDTAHYNVSEDRAFDTYGIKADYTIRLSHALGFKFGALPSVTTGQELFHAVAADGSTGPESNSGLTGHDIGVYAQTAIAPVEWFELRTGVRYDSHVAPFAGDQHQLSPRVRLNFYPDPANTIYLYYGRLFVPTNIEDLRAITSAGDSGVVTAPTLPERDNFYELGYIHRFPFGVVAKLSGYHKESSPGIDDNTVPGSAITTSVNIQQVRITGVEAAVEVRPNGPVSGYVNFALNHAYGFGAITGGFFPAAPPSGSFDLDHDQRISALASVVYSGQHFYLGSTGTFGSGLTNGLSPDPSDPSLPSYGTGLFDFNRGYKVDPSFILDLSAGYAMVIGGSVVRPEIHVNNVFDHWYLLKGAFFSGASVGRPRTVQVQVSVSY
ncbi:MAG TPA: TonB-dependent receptor [Gemmatimonadaceae bacterium]|jgi:hypothetical protein